MHKISTQYGFLNAAISHSTIKVNSSFVLTVSMHNSGKSVIKPSKPLKWFVLITYGLLATSISMAWLMFAPIPKQTASYFGITGKLKNNNAIKQYTMDVFM